MSIETDRCYYFIESRATGSHAWLTPEGEWTIDPGKALRFDTVGEACAEVLRRFPEAPFATEHVFCDRPSADTSLIALKTTVEELIGEYRHQPDAETVPVRLSDLRDIETRLRSVIADRAATYRAAHSTAESDWAPDETSHTGRRGFSAYGGLCAEDYELACEDACEASDGAEPMNDERRHSIEQIRDHWLGHRGADGSDWEAALAAVYDLGRHAFAVHLAPAGDARPCSACGASVPQTADECPGCGSRRRPKGLRRRREIKPEAACALSDDRDPRTCPLHELPMVEAFGAYGCHDCIVNLLERDRTQARETFEANRRAIEAGEPCPMCGHAARANESRLCVCGQPQSEHTQERGCVELFTHAAERACKPVDVTTSTPRAAQARTEGDSALNKEDR